MTRIKITLPEKFVYKTELVLRISDINYGGHLANDAVLSIAHESRIRFLQSMNYSEMNIEGLGIIMTDAAIVYKSQGFHGDETKVNIAVDEFSKYGFDIFYLITNQNDKEIARVKTGIAFFDYAQEKLATVPLAFQNRINSI